MISHRIPSPMNLYKRDLQEDDIIAYNSDEEHPVKILKMQKDLPYERPERRKNKTIKIIADLNSGVQYKYKVHTSNNNMYHMKEANSSIMNFMQTQRGHFMDGNQYL